MQSLTDKCTICDKPIGTEPLAISMHGQARKRQHASCADGPVMHGPVPCIACGRPITVVGTYRGPGAFPKCCSRHCSKESERQWHKRKAATRGQLKGRTCESCGATYDGKMHSQRFCSPKCRVAGHRAARKPTDLDLAKTSLDRLDDDQRRKVYAGIIEDELQQLPSSSRIKSEKLRQAMICDAAAVVGDLLLEMLHRALADQPIAAGPKLRKGDTLTIEQLRMKDASDTYKLRMEDDSLNDLIERVERALPERQAKTVVVNMRKDSPDAELIAKAKEEGRFVRIDNLTSNRWKSPFVSWSEEGGRDDGCDQYEEWILTQPKLLESIGELRGKVLGCYCKPKRCIGDTLARLANAQK